jgi:fructokinase
MRKIYAIGETLFDIIFKDGHPQAGKPGGAMLNTTVSLGRIGLPVYLISEYGDDDIGKIIDKFLQDNGVDTGNTDHFRDGNTALAIAVLNDRNDASYTFYKKYPSRRLEMAFPVINENDIIHCGSIYAVTSEIRRRFTEFVSRAQESGAIVVYDPNFRKSHLSDLDRLRPFIIENMQMSGIVRGSDEDFENIFGAKNADEAYSAIRKFCAILVYTSSIDGVYVRTPGYSGRFPVRKIIPVSTIGAGDNFNAGMITAIYNNGITRNQLEKLGEERWNRIVSTGVDFATEVCLSYENYISKDFARKFKRKT